MFIIVLFVLHPGFDPKVTGSDSMPVEHTNHSPNSLGQLALLVHVLYHSEKLSIQKNIGHVLCFHGMFQL